MKHPLLTLAVSHPSANALPQTTAGQEIARDVPAVPGKAAVIDQGACANQSLALLDNSSRSRRTLKLDADLTKADDPQFQNSAGTAAAEVPAELRVLVPVTLRMGLDAAPEIDSAGTPGLASTPAQTSATAVEVAPELHALVSAARRMRLDEAPKIDSAGTPALASTPDQTSAFPGTSYGLEQPVTQSERRPETDADHRAVAANQEPLVSTARTTLSCEAQRSNNMLFAGGSHSVPLTTPLKGQATAARTGENLPGELAFAARLVERVESGDASQPAARSSSVPPADGASHPAQTPFSRQDLAARALAPRAGNFDESKPGPITSGTGVHEAPDDRPDAAMKSATLSDGSGAARSKTDLEASEKSSVGADTREAAPTPVEPSAGKPAGTTVISPLEPAHAATLSRNPEPGGAPQASTTEASTAAAAAEKSAAVVRSAEPARDITLRLTPDQKTNVEVRLVDRGGEVRVAVRSADQELAQSMRAGLSDLAERLGERGFKADIWHPEPAGSSAGFSSFRPGSESAGQQDSRQHEGSGQHAGRNPNQQQQPGQQHQQRRPQWVEELEHTLSLTSPLKRSQQA